MSKKYSKKLIGTSLLLTIILGAFLISSDKVRAQYMEIMNTVVTDGYVIAVNDSPKGFTLYNAGINILPLKVNDHTNFIGFPDGDNLSDILKSGNWVKVIAKIKDGFAVAKVVKKNGDHGYGNPGIPVVIHDAVIWTKDPDTPDVIIIKSKITDIIITLNISTHFVGQSLDELGVGEKLTVIGTDSGTQFLAKTIISKWQDLE